jgi:hypothetical protein
MPFEIAAGNKGIAPGTYKGQLVEVGIKNGETGDYRLWDFVAEVDGELVPVSATSSMNTGPKSKAFQWLTALTGRAPQAGEVIEDPIGKTVLLTISQKDNGFPKVDLLTAYVEPAKVGDVPR